jgi:very-long-chain (3R)-3-hydroxyacyl-CoA dehydratase
VFLTCWTEVISIIKADGDLTSVTNGSFWQKPVDYVPYDLGVTLTWVQTAASMEIIHAVLGLVGASPMTTALQVFSRVWVVWAVFLVAPQSTTSFFTLLCITSWASVEVPRYGYLATKELAKLFASKDGESSAEAPYFLKWIRYSLFAVLYPTGITGELGCMYQTYLYLQENPVMVPIKIQPELPPIVSIPLMWLLVGVALTYVQGAPTMYGHMNKQRAKYLGTGSKSKKE